MRDSFVLTAVSILSLSTSALFDSNLCTQSNDRVNSSVKGQYMYENAAGEQPHESSVTRTAVAHHLRFRKAAGKSSMETGHAQTMLAVYKERARVGQCVPIITLCCLAAHRPGSVRCRWGTS